MNANNHKTMMRVVDDYLEGYIASAEQAQEQLAERRATAESEFYAGMAFALKRVRDFITEYDKFYERKSETEETELAEQVAKGGAQ